MGGEAIIILCQKIVISPQPNIRLTWDQSVNSLSVRSLIVPVSRSSRRHFSKPLIYKSNPCKKENFQNQFIKRIWEEGWWLCLPHVISFQKYPFSTRVNGKKNNDNDLHALKQILYGIGHLTDARWLFQKKIMENWVDADSPTHLNEIFHFVLSASLTQPFVHWWRGGGFVRTHSFVNRGML